jgi:hypothetical protein
MIAGIGDRGRYRERAAQRRRFGRHYGLDHSRHVPSLGAHGNTL